MLRYYIFLLLILSLLTTCTPETVTPSFKATVQWESGDVFVKLDNQSQKGIAYLWDFGDGRTDIHYFPKDTLFIDSDSVQRDSIHLYRKSGTYNISLTVTGNDETKVSRQTVNIPPLEVSIGVDTNGYFQSGMIHLFAQYDTTQYRRMQYIWDFGDGSPRDTLSKDTIPHPYLQGGNYTIRLRAQKYDEVGEAVTSIRLPDRKSSLFADFKAKVEDYHVVFSNLSSQGEGIVYEWDFGDGKPFAPLTNTNTINRNYRKSGVYTVRLTVKRGQEIAIATKTIQIRGIEANFDFSITNNLYKVAFINQSTVIDGMSFQWEFGDGDTSSRKNPDHTYSKSGTYEVKLTAKIYDEEVSVTKSVQIGSIQANFDFTINSDPYKVTFDNKSIPINGIRFIWDFGDGDTTSKVSPDHTYLRSGIYEVKLTVTLYDESVVVTKTIQVKPIQVNFDFTIGANPCKVVFENKSTTIDGVSFHWDFGDGNTSTEINPDHTYTKSGTYEVKLIAKIYEDELIATKSIQVTSIRPDFDFTIAENRYDITFENKSSLIDGVSFSWDFGNGQTSNLPNPGLIHYPTGGTYQVMLTSTKGNDQAKITKTVNIPLLKPFFSFTSELLSVNLNASLSENALPGATYTWNLGDGMVKTGQMITHTFGQSGAYDVTLTINQGSSLESKSVSKLVIVNAIIPNFEVSKPSDCVAPCVVTITNTSQNIPAGYDIYWRYEEGGLFTQRNEIEHTYTYNNAGTFTITMEIRKGSVVTATAQRQVVILSGSGGGSVNLFLALNHYYPFNRSLANVAGTNVGTVSSGNANYTLDRRGFNNRALRLNGNKSVNTQRNITTSSRMAFSFWLKNDNNYGGKGDLLDNGAIYIGYDNFNLVINANGNISRYSITSNFAWTHFVINMDQNGVIEVYENNAPSPASGANTWNTTGVGTLIIGRKIVGTANPYNGVIDDIRVYTRTLNRNEISALYNE